jgi:hypothetical protein
MSVKIERFEWDERNLGHLRHAHSDCDIETLMDFVAQAKFYLNFGYDRYGKRVYGARRGRTIVFFNLKAGRMARIFSVREE